MILREALPQDRGMYFHKTYMQHDNGLVGRVVVRPDASVDFQKLTGDVIRNIPVHELNIWFPKPAAYNFRAGAAFLCRSAKRSMKKSACTTLYRAYGPSTIQVETLLKIAASDKPHEYVETTKAIQLLRERLRSGVAISKEVILGLNRNDPDTQNLLVYRNAQRVGYLSEDNVFLPDDPDSPYTTRVKKNLRRLGIK